MRDCLRIYFNSDGRATNPDEALIPTYFYLTLLRLGVPLTIDAFLDLTIGQTELLLMRAAELLEKERDGLSVDGGQRWLRN